MKFSQVFQRLKNIITLDTTSLAYFRIFFGIVLLLWLGDWLYQLDWLLGDQAIVPPALSFKYFMRDTTRNFHLLHGHSSWYYFLFAIHIFLTLAFIIGWNTKQVTILLWIFTVSLWSSNIPAYNHFDTLFGVMLFWSIFLPLGYSLSYDSFHSSGSWKRANMGVCSLATLGVFLQIFIVYVYASYLRWDDTRVKDMTGLWYVLQNTILAFPLGTWLAKQTSLVHSLSMGYMLLEMFGFLGFLSPRKQHFFRKITICSFIALHIGILFTMDIEVISLEMIAIWLLFRPRVRAGYFRQKLGFLEGFLQVFVIAFVGLRCFLILKPQYAYLLPNNYHRYGKMLGVTQSWGAFLGKHSTFSWYTIEGITASGSISVLPKRAVFSLENAGTKHYLGEKQRKFFENIWYYRWLPERMLEYYCEKYKDRVNDLRLHKVWQQVDPETGYGPLQSTIILQKSCTLKH